MSPIPLRGRRAPAPDKGGKISQGSPVGGAKPRSRSRLIGARPVAFPVSRRFTRRRAEGPPFRCLGASHDFRRHQAMDVTLGTPSVGAARPSGYSGFAADAPQQPNLSAYSPLALPTAIAPRPLGMFQMNHFPTIRAACKKWRGSPSYRRPILSQGCGLDIFIMLRRRIVFCMRDKLRPGPTDALNR